MNVSRVIPVRPAVRLLGACAGRPASAVQGWRRASERLATFARLASARRDAFPVEDFNPERDRYIILSDAHKGTRQPRLDDFAHNEAVYCAALAHYADEGYRLILNGDAEEGWKTNLGDVMAAYADTAFAAERAFAARGPAHYLRVYGNHDGDWANPAQVERYLAPVLGKLRVHSGVMLGRRILVTHGHQGDPNSDVRSWLSRRVVRYLWRPIQHLLGWRLEDVVRLYTALGSREQHLADWAAANRTLLITGHTHRPMLNLGEAQPGCTYYINDGACVHRDGITGVELAGGEIRLVQWAAPTRQDRAIRRRILERADLQALLAAL